MAVPNMRAGDPDEIPATDLARAWEKLSSVRRRAAMYFLDYWLQGGMHVHSLYIHMHG